MPSPDEYFDSIHRIMSVLDEENIRVISTMKKFSPRNLQQVARRSKVPYPTVYTRVNKLEKERLFHSWVYPNFSKIGMARAVVYLTPSPGRELLAREGLRIPGYWIRIIRCAGECNGYYSLHAVPAQNRQEFEQYFEQLVTLGLATDYRVFWLEEFNHNIPNFEYYDVKKKTWKFNWQAWLKLFRDDGRAPRSEGKELQKAAFDRNDLLILKELMKDGRTKLSDFAKMLGITLPAAKYRFDNIVKKGLIQEYCIDILPYPPEISDLCEVRIDFRDENVMATNEKILKLLPFVVNYSRIRGSNSITVRVYIIRNEMNNLVTFLSALVRRKILDRFSYVVLFPPTIEAQTFSYEYFDNGSGWRYDNREFLGSLRKLLSNFEKGDYQTAIFEQPPALMSLV